MEKESPFITETLPDLGIDEEEYDELDEIVLNKKYKNTGSFSGERKGCC